MNKELIIGSHVSFTSKTQLLGALEEALSYNANTFMFYTGAPQNTRRYPINDELTFLAYNKMKELNFDSSNLIIHAPYIINLANSANFDFSVEFLQNEVERAELLGVKYIVLHPGSSVNYSHDEAMHNIIKGLNLVLDNSNNVIILVETMAGKGTELGKNISEVKEIIDGINNKNKIGVCLDTCHLSDSGIDLNNIDDYLCEFDKSIGLSYIKCVHINDSKNILGSHKDRHENIGYGNIGFDTMMKIIYHDKLKGIPMILETPYVTLTDDLNDKEKSLPPYKYEIEMIRNKKFNEHLIEDIRNN